MKRPATNAGGRGKAAKKDPELGAIRELLSEAEGFPARVLEMLAAGVETSLPTRRDLRHGFQEEVAGMVGEVLAAVRLARQRAGEALAERIAASDSERACREGRAEAARAEAEAKSGAVEAAKVALSDASRAVGAAKAALAVAKTEQRSGDEGLVAAAGRKAQLEALVGGDYAALKRGDAANVTRAVKAFAKSCRDLSIEAQLLESAQLALTKKVAARGSFDGMVLEQFEGELSSRTAAIEAELASGEAGRVERASRVEAAEREMAAATEAFLCCKGGLEASQAALGEAEAEARAAEASVKDLGPELKRLEAELAEAHLRLQAADEVLGSFARLQSRTTADDAPPAPPADDAPPEAAAEAQATAD